MGLVRLSCSARMASRRALLLHHSTSFGSSATPLIDPVAVAYVDACHCQVPQEDLIGTSLLALDLNGTS